MIEATEHQGPASSRGGFPQTGMAVLNDQEFNQFSALIYRIAGISM